jgi:hypothetical protein
MSHKDNMEWYCPLYKKNISEGKCLDINYERLEYMDSGCLLEATKLTGKTKEQIDRTCEVCPNLPIKE